jgi:hypothetical protein
MADANVTPSQVSSIASPTPNKFIVISGEAITAGDWLYQTNASNGWYFRANTSNALSSGSQGSGLVVALGSTAGAGQPVQVQNTGQITLGTNALVSGEQYTLSVNSGKIGAAGDRLTGEFDTYIGYAVNTTTLQLMNGMPGKTQARTTNA